LSRSIQLGRRVDSIDVLRGLAVAGMIVVNNPGDWTAVFPPLLHAYWTGLTLADVVFPAFIFLMGAAMPFAFDRRRADGSSSSKLYRHMARRVVFLIAIGLALNAMSAWPDVAPLRLPGVLQRIALTYLVAGVVVLHVRPSRWLAAAAAFLIGHWALLVLVPFGGYPAGTMTPDHNLARFLDTLVFGRHALSIPNEPEGLLGTLPASASALLGAAAADVIRRAPGDAVRLRALIAGGAAALVIGLIWSRALPLSKPLWTGSCVLVTAGLTAMVLGAIYWLVDARGLRRWCRPFAWLGVNALAIYIGSEIVRRLLDAAVVRLDFGRTTPKAWLFWEVLEPALPAWPTEFVSFLFGLGILAMWMGFGAMLNRYRIRVRV
jgi:predicted acyltransferase